MVRSETQIQQDCATAKNDLITSFEIHPSQIFYNCKEGSDGSLELDGLIIQTTSHELPEDIQEKIEAGIEFPSLGITATNRLSGSNTESIMDTLSENKRNVVIISVIIIIIGFYMRG
jgi:hypothetical protein